MFNIVAQALAYIYNIVPSYGLSIMLLTLVIMILLTPLTLKGTRSMLMMQQLQPEMKKLQAKYKDDRTKLNEELLAFYKENKINPMSGCLPLLLQMPVFFVLYRVLYGLTQRQPFGADMGSLATRVMLTGPQATFSRFGDFNPAYLDHTSKMYRDLSSTNKMMFLGIDLSNSALKALSQGFVYALPFLIVVVIVAITSYIQQKQVSGRTPAAQQNPQQQMLLKVMPAFFAVISLTMPGGVVLYFLVSNLYRVGQQAFITRTMYAPGAPGAVIAARAAEAKPSKDDAPPAKKGFFGALGISSDAMPNVGKKAAAGNGSSAKGKAGTGSNGSPGKAGAGKAGGTSKTTKRVQPGTGKSLKKVDQAPKGGGGSSDSSAARSTKAVTPPKGRPTPPSRSAPAAPASARTKKKGK